MDLARRDNLTLRQLANLVGGTRGHLTAVGTGVDIANEMEKWVAHGAADGFLLYPHSLPEGIEEFAEFVVPELRRRKLLEEGYQGRTLRESLGLPAV